jgi:hypothetical protein
VTRTGATLPVVTSDREFWRSCSEPPNENAKARVSRLAQRQFGRISAAQLVRLGVGRTTISDWAAASYLHRVLPRVYAVGHTAASVEADLAAGLLYAGPGTMLSHAIGAWWYELIDPERPVLIDLSSPHRASSRHNLKIHGRRQLPRGWHRGLPITTPAQTLIDLAATAPEGTVRYALATAEYRRLLTVSSLAQALPRGRRGSPALRAAIRSHEPRLAQTRSRLERHFIALCERYRIPLPEVSVPFQGYTIDVMWRQNKLAVELDGYDNHSTPGQIAADRRRDLALRAAGFVVVRYSWDQILRQPDAVAADLERLLSG